jgi:ADP-ribose pyrophosphatase YjhB (NUDIX family)
MSGHGEGRDELGSATAAAVVQRVAAYGVARRDGAVLLVRSSGCSDFPGSWSLPGGGVDHGEHPLDTVVREFEEETGLTVRVVGAPTLHSDVLDIRGGSVRQHSVRVVVDVAVTGGVLTDEHDGSTDAARWVPLTEVAHLPLMRFARAALGLPDGETVG